MSSGACAVRSIPADRWSLERLSHPRIAERGRSYTWAAGCLDDIWGFDPGAFGMSPREAEMIDPQQRLLLELTWEALEDAGVPPSRLAGTDTGVFVGVSAVDHSTLRLLDMSSADAYMMTGNTLSIVANRISYIFDLHGPSFIVDTACSSGLVALNEAIVNLRSGRIDTAIVGGVSVLATPHAFVGFSQAAMLSRRGLCQAFSANADGYVRAEGGAVFMLQTRAAAERDGNPIHALITASDVNSDGRTNGISLPSKHLQAKLLEKLYIQPGVDLDRLAFFEAHGTGTPVGDPIEASAIGETIARRRSKPLLIGSVKTNIGHMEAASGLGGLLKAMLALQHNELPASLHSEDLNPHIDFEGLNLQVAREATALPRRRGAPRLAGVNSFGFGGTNAHVTLADAPLPPEPVVDRAPCFFVVSAHSRGALRALAANYAARLESAGDAEALAIAAASAHHRDLLSHRIVLPLAERAEVAARLRALCDDDQEVVGAARGSVVEREAPVAFVFSGNGSQFVGMGVAAYKHNAYFRERLDSLSQRFETIAGWSLVDTMHSVELAERIDLTRVAQPLMFAIQSATNHALRAYGLEPGWVVGHSVGEVAAAEAAGHLDDTAALDTIYARSQHQELTAGHGTMAVVIGSREATEQILALLPDLTIAAHNSPRAFTLSGSKSDIARLHTVARRFKARTRKLDLEYPFHSALMAPVEQPLLDSLASLVPRQGNGTFISTVTGAVLDGAQLDARYWWRNVREPVLFSAAITVAFEQGARIFIEVGASPTLLSHMADTIDERVAAIAALPTLDKRDKGCDPIKLAVATAIARGARVDRGKAFGTPPTLGSRVDLPLYPWQRKTFRLPDTTESVSNTLPTRWHPLIGARFNVERLEWHSSLDTTLNPALADHCVEGRAILPGAAFAEMALAVARDWLGCDAAVIADLEISSPMQLGPDIGREVLCRLSPLINHVEILSRPRLGQAPWQSHATAKIVRDPTVGLLPQLDDHAPPHASHPVTGAEIYAMAERAGLRYGPSFQKLRSAVAVQPDRITLDLTDEEADPAFAVDPARLDACFHALVLVFSSLRDAVHDTAYIPVRFGEITLRKPGVTFVEGRIDVLRRDERIIVANLLLTDAAGETVLYLREVRFQAIRTSRATDAVRKMIYRTTILASEPTSPRSDRLLTVQTFRRGLAAENATVMSDDFVLLDGWATSLALQTARGLATADVIDAAAIVASNRVPARIRSWLEEILTSLDRSGLSRVDQIGRHIDPDAILPTPDEILRTIAFEHQHLSAELLVAASTMTAVNAIEAGNGANIQRSLSAKVLDGFELGSHFAHGAAAFLAATARRSVAGWPKERATRILQIGVGPLTSMIAPLVDSAQARLTVFDPDRRRLERARMAFGDRGDIDLVEKIEDLPGRGFDLVLATNVLHRHRRLPGFLAAMRRAMAPGAVFAAVEPTPSFFRDLVFGLDAALADGDDSGFDGLSVSETDWLEALHSIGLGDVEVSPVNAACGTALLLTGQVEAERRSSSGAGTALIIGDGDAQATSGFATLLASSGIHVSIHLDEEISGGHPDDPPAFVVVFARKSDPHVLPVKSLTRQCMNLKRLADTLGQTATKVWLITSGAVDPLDERGSDVAAGLWAFSRTLANEYPNLELHRVDVAEHVRPEILAERLRDLVMSGTDETEIVIRHGGTHVVRFELGAAHERGQGSRAAAARLKRGSGAGIDRLYWQATSRPEPSAKEVEIKVEAVGLNFRDVMFGLGLLPEDILEHGFAGPTLGLECAGRVERVGSAVRTVKPGDRVMAFAKDAFSTHVTTPAAMLAPLPEGMSFEMAATIPVAFLTAYYALIHCARLRPNEWVLIHGGAGGVGLAAIQIARWRGARIIVTAGTPERRALLTALGAEHAFDSRSGAFAEDVRRVTGDGVSVVLNSLSGEAMERSVGVLKPFGRFVELGKRDYVANTHIGLRPFRRNLSYFGVDLDQVLIDDPIISRSLIRAVTRLLARGELSPLPYRVFDAGDTVDAFRLMQNSGHIGKLVVRPPQPGDSAGRPKPHFQVSADKIHLITGGFGGFGLATARWLAVKGARDIMLLGRSGPASEEARTALTALRAQGVRVRSETLDVGDKATLAKLFARFGKDLPTLGGVIHAAMVLDDAMISTMSADRVERVLRPKIAGADNLDQLTQDLKLDYFLLYSSATTLIGNPGQAAYVAANGYLEGLARRRRRAGLPAMAVAWGAIEDVGILARTDATREALASRVGFKGMLAQDALHAMEHVLGLSSNDIEDAVVAIAPVTWSAARLHLAVLKSPSYRKLAGQDDVASSAQDKIDIVKLVANKPADEARTLITGLIVDEIARVLRLPREDVARTTPLAEIGLDSLMAVELALGLEERFILNGPLTTTASSFSVNELADHIIGLATGTVGDDEAITRQMIQRHLGDEAVSSMMKDADELKERTEMVLARSHAMRGILH